MYRLPGFEMTRVIAGAAGMLDTTLEPGTPLDGLRITLGSWSEPEPSGP